MHAREDSQSGFALFETIVALAIVALALGIIGQGIGNGYRASARTKSFATSVIAAQSQLARAGVEEPLQPGIFDGAYPNRVRWRMTVTPIGGQNPALDATNPPRAYWVTLAVLDRRGRDLFVLETAKVPEMMP